MKSIATRIINSFQFTLFINSLEVNVFSFSCSQQREKQAIAERKNLTRDERKAIELKIPFTTEEIINSPVEEFNDMIEVNTNSAATASDARNQLTRIRDFTRPELLICAENFRMKIAWFQKKRKKILWVTDPFLIGRFRTDFHPNYLASQTHPFAFNVHTCHNHKMIFLDVCCGKTKCNCRCLN